MDRSDMMHRMYDIKGPLVAKKFAARGFEAVYCPTKEEALKQAISYIPETDVVSWGGSVSINEIGLRPYVLEHNPVIDRDSAKTPEERVELMRKALLCDTFLMGANAAVQDGQLINIDGNGNRVAALCYGPKQVIAMLNEKKQYLTNVRGNCDAEVDQMVLEFPVLADYGILIEGGHTFYMSHGHIYNEQNLPPLMDGDIFLYGHTHVLRAEKKGAHTFLNPGSVSLPKEGNIPTYAILEDGVFTIKGFDGTVVKQLTL